MSKKVKVLVVDDSAIVRKVVSEALSKDPEIEVVGTAIDPYVARDKIIKFHPDVITLDIEMPRMDGLTFLNIIMQNRPMPVIVMSSLTQSGSEHAMKALQAGAFDVLAKPAGSFSVGHLAHQLAERVKAAAGSKYRRKPQPAPAPSVKPASPKDTRALPAKAPSVIHHTPAPSNRIPDTKHAFNRRQLLLLGASTGGTEALKDVLSIMPADLPGILIVQHIPAYFSKAFADRLNSVCAFEVREATDGDEIRPGLALVAPGDYHMLVHWQTNAYKVQLKQGPPVWHQRPAVDVLFNSAVECVGSHGTAAIFTGMGKDGAQGMLKLKQAGAATFAQDENSCVVFGMPKAAMEIGAAQKMVPLDHMAQTLVKSVVSHH